MQIALGIHYVHVLLRAKKMVYSYRGLEAVFAGLRQATFQIEEYPIYNCFIVYGEKEIPFSKEEYNASRG